MDNTVLSRCFWDRNVGSIHGSTQSKYEQDYSLSGIKGTKIVLATDGCILPRFLLIYAVVSPGFCGAVGSPDTGCCVSRSKVNSTKET